MRAIPIGALLLSMACGAAPPPTATQLEPPPPETPPAPFAAHGPLVLRSASPQAQPPFYVELAADGSITGTRCGATRFTDEGVLEREGVAVARVSSDGDALVVSAADGTALGWRIEHDTMITVGAARFVVSEGRITPSDTDLVAIDITPADAPASLVLAVFAELLACDDVGP